MDKVFQTAREPHSNKQLTIFKGYEKLIIKFKKQNEYNETAKGIYQENGK